MKKNNSKIEISTKLYKDICDFCILNELIINEYIENLLKESFLKDKYGEMPSIFEKNEEKSDIEEKNNIKNFENKEKNTIFVDKVSDLVKEEEKTEPSTVKPVKKEETVDKIDIPPKTDTRKRRKLN